MNFSFERKNNCFRRKRSYSMHKSSRGVIVRSEVVETEFGFYTDEEIKSLSVCKVTSPLAFDALGNALPG